MSIMNLSQKASAALLQDAISRDRTTARRVILFEILRQESYLTREQLISRIEGNLGKDCFGKSAWQDTFFRDMQIVKRALDADGYELAYSRRLQRKGYYLRYQPNIGPDLSAVLDGSVAEVSQAQIASFKRLSIEQRFKQGCEISNLARQVVAYRIRRRNPQIETGESHRLAIQENVKKEK